MEKLEIFESMKNTGLFEYGSIIPQSLIHQYFGITMPKTGTQKDFQEPVLQELASTGFIREKLYSEGKYLKKDGEAYRILLPSETAGQVQNMVDSAKRKMRNAQKLDKNRPKNKVEPVVSPAFNLQKSIERMERYSALIA